MMIRTAPWLILSCLALAACGGGSSSPDAAPTPTGSTPAPAGATPPTGTPATGAATGTATAVPAGDPVGGTTVKPSSGYLDTLLTGRWESEAGDAPDPRIGQCVEIPALPFCPTAYSIRHAEYGFIASGLNATEISRIEFYSGAACSSTVRSVYEVRNTIQFKATDTLIPDATPGATGNIAVRQGDIVGDPGVTIIENNFQPAGCKLAGSIPDPTTPDPTPEACAETVSIRLVSVTGLPRLFKDDESVCQPGATKPTPKYTMPWIQSIGQVKR